MIDTNRLEEIEAIAQAARTLAAERFRHLGATLERVCNMPLAAMVLTSGMVDPAPNLTRAGERLAGVLEGNPACPTILFEQYDPPVRQRFSVAHELGHYFLHHLRDHPPASDALMRYQRCVQHRVDPEAGPDDSEASDIEAEADAFAGAFLLPADQVRADRAQYGACVAFFAERYGVSEAALRRRIRALELVRA